jgi:GxxExxY protein
MSKIIHEELSGEIIGVAMQVLNELKPGLDEKLYERAMMIELRRHGHAVEAQREFPVFYRDEPIGHLTPDLIIDDKIVVDPKVVSAFNEAGVAQMIGYLTISGLELALLLNFKSARLEWKRIVQQHKKESCPPTCMLNVQYPRHPHCYRVNSPRLAKIFSGSLRNSFIRGRLSVMGIRPTLSFLTVILCGPLSHLRYQRNPRSKLSVAAEPRWVIRG